MEAGGVKELLGDDYPYLCRLDEESVKAKVRYAKETFGGPIWFKGLQRMEHVLTITSESAIVAGYRRVFGNLEARCLSFF